MPKAVCIGDSITAGTYVLTPYPALLQTRLQAVSSDWEVVNKGISNDLTQQMRARFLADVVNEAPEYVVIFGGVNDINAGAYLFDTTRANIEWMCDTALSHSIHPILCLLPPIGGYRSILLAAELNAWISEYSTAQGFGVIDWFTPLEDSARPGYMLTDYCYVSVHPNELGFSMVVNSIDLATFYLPDIVINSRLLQTDVSWCWFSEPRAIHNTITNRTYYGYTKHNGEIVIAQYNHGTNRLTTFTLDTHAEDDHNDPAICILNDGRILVFHARHTADKSLRYRISNLTGDISTLSSERILTASDMTSYAQIFYKAPIVIVFSRVSSGSDVYLTSAWVCRISNDNGATWGSEIRVFDWGADEKLYIRSSWRWDVEDNTIGDIILSAHPEHGIQHSVHYCYLQINSETDIKILKPTPDGPVQLFDLLAPSDPLGPSSCLLVYDWTIDHRMAWVWDVYATSPDYIVALYATFPAATPTGTDHRYNYARYNPLTGEFDIKSEICASKWCIAEEYTRGNGCGWPYYSGGFHLAKRSGVKDTIHASICDPISNQFEIVDFISSDGGTTWETSAKTENSSVKNIRPVPVINANPNFVMCWARGTYVDCLHYNTAMYVLGEEGGPHAGPQYVVIPCYRVAGKCTHETTSVIDTFENTGNELILLKHGNANNCCVHEIAVRGNRICNPLTITLKPNRGTFIGPYPLDDYGALLTVEYDNTNFYVSILKVVPYTDQT